MNVPCYRSYDGLSCFMITDCSACPQAQLEVYDYAADCFISRLPSELLDEIFSWSRPSVPSFRTSDSPLLLTQVCSWWRDHAIAQSTLWDTIYLPSPLEGLSNGIIELCRLWLERSKQCPLSVDFHLTSDYQPWSVSDEHFNNMRRIVKFLVPHAHRITRLLRIFPCFLLEELRLDDMINLDDLFICDTADSKSGHARPGARGFAVPSRLRCLSLRQTNFNLEAFTSLEHVVHLDLWQLQGGGQMSVGHCLQLLQAMPWIESCTLDVAMGSYKPEDLLQEVSMPRLTFFFISWDWLVDVGPILDRLRTPNLRRLGLRGPPPVRRQWSNLKNFLERCRPSLSQLSIKEIGFADIQLLACLSLVPTLTNLSLSHCSLNNGFIKALRLNDRIPIMQNVLPFLDYLSLEACVSFDHKELVRMLSTRGKLDCGHRLRGVKLTLCQMMSDAHRAEVESCGIEDVILRIYKSPRRQTM